MSLDSRESLLDAVDLSVAFGFLDDLRGDDDPYADFGSLAVFRDAFSVVLRVLEVSLFLDGDRFEVLFGELSVCGRTLSEADFLGGFRCEEVFLGEEDRVRDDDFF